MESAQKTANDVYDMQGILIELFTTYKKVQCDLHATIKPIYYVTHVIIRL